MWKDIIGHEGHYQVSNLGRVKSLQRTLMQSNNHPITINEKILKPSLNGMDYWTVCLGYRNRQRVHRLIAKAFIPNPENKPFINHKNGVRKDNRIENLEWCTHSENMIHAYRVLQVKPPATMLGKFGKDNPLSKKIVCLNNGNIYYGISEAARQLGLSVGNISEAVNGKIKHTKGFSFRFINNENDY